MMTRAECDGSVNTFTGETIPCGWGIEGIEKEMAVERAIKHQESMGSHYVRVVDDE